jgi:hypothetical protein
MASSPSAFAACFADIDDILADVQRLPIAMSPCSTMFTEGRHLVLRDIEGELVGMVAEGALAQNVAICRSGKAQVTAAELDGAVHVWETCAPGSNLAMQLRCENNVKAVEVNERYVVALTEHRVSFAVHGFSNAAWTHVPVSGVISASFDGSLESILWIATTTGPRILDVSMGPAAAAVVPVHTSTSPWSNDETFADAQALCRRPVDLRQVNIAQQRRVPGPRVCIVSGHHPLAAFATENEVHICDSSIGGHVVVSETAVALSVCNFVCVASSCSVAVYNGAGEVLRDILCIAFPVDILATTFGIRIRTTEGVDSLVFTDRSEIYL